MIDLPAVLCGHSCFFSNMWHLTTTSPLFSKNPYWNNRLQSWKVNWRRWKWSARVIGQPFVPGERVIFRLDVPKVISSGNGISKFRPGAGCVSAFKQALESDKPAALSLWCSTLNVILWLDTTLYSIAEQWSWWNAFSVQILSKSKQWKDLRGGLQEITEMTLQRLTRTHCKGIPPLNRIYVAWWLKFPWLLKTQTGLRPDVDLFSHMLGEVSAIPPRPSSLFSLLFRCEFERRPQAQTWSEGFSGSSECSSLMSQHLRQLSRRLVWTVDGTGRRNKPWGSAVVLRVTTCGGYDVKTRKRSHTYIMHQKHFSQSCFRVNRLSLE